MTYCLSLRVLRSTYIYQMISIIAIHCWDHLLRKFVNKHSGIQGICMHHILFVLLKAPVLQFCFVVWTPYQLVRLRCFPTLRIIFINILGRRLEFTYRDTPTENIQENFGVQHLHLRRKLARKCCSCICWWMVSWTVKTKWMVSWRRWYCYP